MRNWILRDLSNDSLLEAVERNTLEHLFFLPSRHPSMDVINDDNLIIVDTKIPSFPLNFACATKRSSQEDLQKKILETNLNFKKNNRDFSWFLGPSFPYGELSSYFKKVGFSTHQMIEVLVHNLTLFSKKLKYIPKFRVQQALGKKTLLEFAEVFSDSFEKKEEITLYFNKVSLLAFHSLDPMKFFVGYLDEVPCICGELFLGAGVAGVKYFVKKQVGELEKELVIDLVTKMFTHAKHQGYHWGAISCLDVKKDYFIDVGFRSLFNYYLVFK